jgi:hypothetical protein
VPTHGRKFVVLASKRFPGYTLLKADVEVGIRPRGSDRCIFEVIPGKEKRPTDVLNILNLPIFNKFDVEVDDY